MPDESAAIDAGIALMIRGMESMTIIVVSPMRMLSQRQRDGAASRLRTPPVPAPRNFGIWPQKIRMPTPLRYPAITG